MTETLLKDGYSDVETRKTLWAELPASSDDLTGLENYSGVIDADGSEMTNLKFIRYWFERQGFRVLVTNVMTTEAQQHNSNLLRAGRNNGHAEQFRRGFMRAIVIEQPILPDTVQ